MEEKKALTKGIQILIGVVIAICIYGAYIATINLLLMKSGVVFNIIGIIIMLVLPIVGIVGSIKLIKGIKYKHMGITILALAGPILIFSLVSGTCLSIFGGI